MPIITKRPKAKSDLTEIWDYIADDSEAQADKFLDRVDSTIRTVASTPYMGRSRKELSEGLRSFPVGQYLIFYRLIANGIEIVRVLHGSRKVDTGFFLDEE